MQRLLGGRPGLGPVRLLLTIALVFVSVFIFYFWRLGTLTPGLSVTENEARGTSSQTQLISSQPINAPHKLLQYGFQSLDQSGAFWMRLASIAFAMIFIVCFYLLAKAWFGRLIGLLATLMFATTPWVILLARNATPDILLLAPVALMASYVYLSRADRAKRSLAWWMLMVSLALSLYVPGIFWLIIIGLLFAWRSLKNVVGRLPISILSGGILLLLLLITPLVLAIIEDWTLIKSLLLIPDSWPAPLEAIKSLGWAASALVFRTRMHLDWTIGRLPLLDIIQMVLIIFGLYAMWSRARTEMSILAGMVLFGLIAAAVNNNLSLLTLTLPALGLIAAAGLRYLYIEWRQVFPRNPLPKALALALMCAMVALHVVYGARYSLLAWPHTVDTTSHYVIK